MASPSAIRSMLGAEQKAAEYFRAVNDRLHELVSDQPKSAQQRQASEFFYQGDRAAGGFELIADHNRKLLGQLPSRDVFIVPVSKPSARMPSKVPTDPVALLDAWRLGLDWNLYALKSWGCTDNPPELLENLRYLAFRLQVIGGLADHRWRSVSAFVRKAAR